MILLLFGGDYASRELIPQQRKIAGNADFAGEFFPQRFAACAIPSFDFLKRLLETPSPSGFETLGQRVWISYAEQFADRIESDSYGNVFAMLNSEGSPKILLAGHSDELGLMITHISEDGFLYFKGIGGVDRAMLRGRRVIVHGAAGPVPGVTGHLAIHMQEPDDRKKVPEFHEVFIDIGVGSRAEASNSCGWVTQSRLMPMFSS